MTSMRMMILVPSFRLSSPVVGAFLFARYLRSQGRDVTFAALDTPADAPNLLERIDRCGLPRHCFGLDGWAGLRRLERVKRFIAERRIDLVLSYCLRADIVNALVPCRLRIGAVRGEDMGRHYALSYGRLASWIGLAAHMRAVDALDGILVQTPEARRYLLSQGLRPPIFSVNNFVDVSEILADSAGPVPDLGAGIHIGCFGILDRRKRVDVALRGLKELLGRRKDVRLHLVGEGPSQGDLLQEARSLGIEEAVRFRGFLPRPLALMRRMDLVLLTSETEGCPRALIEALALGKTSVSSNIPAVRGLIRDGETGYLFAEGDATALAAVLERVIAGGRYLPGESLTRFVRENYDVESTAAKTWEPIEALASIAGLVPVPETVGGEA